MKIVTRIARILFFFSANFLLASCVSSISYVPPEPTELELQRAQVQINSTGELKGNSLTDVQNRDRLDNVVFTLRPHAKQLCQSLGERSDSGCDFQVLFDDSDEFNAYATTKDGRNVIIITNGALKYTHTESELAFIVAHEYGHHIGNHLTESLGFTVGEGIGLLIGLSIIGDSYLEPDLASDVLSASAELGGMFDRPGFSRSQESEADLFATKLVINAGMNIREATQVLVNMATISNSGGFFSTHPSGPVRLATAKRHIGSSAMANIEMLEGDNASIAKVEPLILPTDNQSKTNSVAFRNESISKEKPHDLANKIREVARGFKHLDDVYVDNFPEKKINGFLDKANLPKNTAILAYLDTTIWGSGKNGVIFTPEGVHYTNDFTSGAGGSHFISYDAIIETGQLGYKNRYFYIGDRSLPENGLVDLLGSSTNMEEFLQLFMRIVESSKVRT